MPRLSEAEFTILRDLIHEHLGLYYQNNKRDVLEDKLSSLIVEHSSGSFLDYYYFLKYDTSAENEWLKVTDALRVTETYFWREIDQVATLVDILLPKFFAQPRARTLRIWSAACSTGEEPLSIAIALREAGWFKRASIEIVASDLSQTAIAKAKQGVYRSHALRNLPAHLRDKYFQPEPNNLWRISPEIHACVRWTTANITVRQDIAYLAPVNFIFCRNVFIYFSSDMIKKTVSQFFELMPTPSYLFVSTSESLLRSTTDFELQEIGGTFIYVKQ